MAICEKCIKKSVCKLCDGSEIMGCIEFIGKGSNVLITDQDEVKLLVEIPKSLYEAAFEGRYTRYDSLNCIKAIRDGQILPDDCEILTKEAYADLCMRASKGNCSEISTGSTVKIDVPDNNVGNIDCISRADAIHAVSEALKHTFVEYEDIANKVIGKLPPVIPQEPKAGHWIEHPHEAGPCWEYSRYECSECHEWADDDSDFCPECGCRMIEPQESEDNSEISS